MPVRDYYHVLAEGEDMTSGVISDILDWGETPVVKGGHPRPLWFEVIITVQPAGGAWTIGVEGADSDGAGGQGTWRVQLRTTLIQSGDVSVGDVLKIPLPMMGLDSSNEVMPDGLPRFLRVHVDVGQTTVTAGECDIVFRGG